MAVGNVDQVWSELHAKSEIPTVGEYTVSTSNTAFKYNQYTPGQHHSSTNQVIVLAVQSTLVFLVLFGFFGSFIGIGLLVSWRATRTETQVYILKIVFNMYVALFFIALTLSLVTGPHVWKRDFLKYLSACVLTYLKCLVGFVTYFPDGFDGTGLLVELKIQTGH